METKTTGISYYHRTNVAAIELISRLHEGLWRKRSLYARIGADILFRAALHLSKSRSSGSIPGSSSVDKASELWAIILSNPLTPQKPVVQVEGPFPDNRMVGVVLLSWAKLRGLPTLIGSRATMAKYGINVGRRVSVSLDRFIFVARELQIEPGRSRGSYVRG